MAPVQRKGLRALQIWCSQVTADYPNVHITDLSTSFRDGLAFNAIIHHFRPDLFDYKALNPAQIRENNDHAFKIAEEHLNVPALLDPEDMVDCEEPDKLSVATYLAQLYHMFKSSSPPATPPSLTRVSSSDDDSLLSTSSSEDSPQPFRQPFNRSELIAKYGEDIFSCSTPPSKTKSPVQIPVVSTTPKSTPKRESNAVASVRKQFEQFAKISAS